MQCQGKFNYKSLGKREAGEFKNERGQLIKYNESYALKVDEILNGNQVVERVFKFPTSNKTLYDKLSTLKIYDTVTLIFNVELYGSQAKLVPIDISIENN